LYATAPADAPDLDTVGGYTAVNAWNFGVVKQIRTVNDGNNAGQTDHLGSFLVLFSAPE